MRLCDDGTNILRDKTKINLPPQWNDPKTTRPSDEANGQKVRTVTELTQRRRDARIPDISFDLDNDGEVGGRDYVISKLFDKDGDGKLNPEEKKAAMQAVKDVSRIAKWNSWLSLGHRRKVLLERGVGRHAAALQNYAEARGLRGLRRLPPSDGHVPTSPAFAGEASIFNDRRAAPASGQVLPRRCHSEDGGL